MYIVHCPNHEADLDKIISKFWVDYFHSMVET